MKKKAQLSESNIHTLIDYIRNRQNAVNLGSFNFPDRGKIVTHPGHLEGEPQAIAHVSSEDAENGIVHLNLGRLSQAIQEKNVPVNKLSNPDSLTKEELVNLIYAFVETFAHELGHIQDFQSLENQAPASNNQFFPGGEGAADSAARSAVQQLSVAATNTSDKIDKSRRFNMRNKTLRILADLANKLDDSGAIKVADIVEDMMRKYAQDATAMAIQLAKDVEAGKYGEGAPQNVVDQIRHADNPARSLRDLSAGFGFGGGDFESRLGEIERLTQPARRAPVPAPVPAPVAPEAPAASPEGSSLSVSAIIATLFGELKEGKYGPRVNHLTMEHVKNAYGKTDPESVYRYLSGIPSDSVEDFEGFSARLSQLKSAISADVPADAGVETPDTNKSFWLKQNKASLPGWFELNPRDPYIYQIDPDGRAMAKRRNDPPGDAHLDLSSVVTDESFGKGDWSELTPIDPLSDDFNPDSATELGAAAKLSPNEKIEKIASDTKKFKKIFWHGSSTPFGR